jgi:hypothetical protein
MWKTCSILSNPLNWENGWGESLTSFIFLVVFALSDVISSAIHYVHSSFTVTDSVMHAWIFLLARTHREVHTRVSKILVIWGMIFFSLIHRLSGWEAAASGESLALSCQSTYRHYPGDSKLHQQRCEYLAYRQLCSPLKIANFFFRIARRFNLK